MKSAPHNKRIALRSAAALITLLIYAASLTAGIFAIIGYSTFQRWEKRPFTYMEELSDAYLSGSLQEVENTEWPNMSVIIYGKDGNRLLTVAPSNFQEGQDMTQPTERYVEDVLSGKSFYRPVFLWSSASLIPAILTIDGVPVISGDTVAGAVFVVNLVPELTDAVLSFFCFYTILYWIAVSCIMITSDKKRRVDQMQQTYIANITHSLKTPIASVKAITETLSDVQTLDEDKKMAYYGTILSEMNTLNHLVCQMLELSKLQSGECQFVKRETCFEETFGPAIEKFKMLCECTRVALDVSEDLYHLPPLRTDVDAAGTVLEILLENAVKYTHPGDTIQIRSTVSKRRVTFCVWDNGGTIPEEDIPYIFERFYKGKNSSFSSSGLGLAIARQTIVNLHEKIWVKCVHPNETMFFFTIAAA